MGKLVEAIERVLSEGAWQKLLTSVDRKRLPPLYSNDVMGLGDDELGYFSLSELAGAGCERDQYWKPTKLSDAKRKERRMQGRED